jgi:4'-phosphopantetheinyl transferase
MNKMSNLSLVRQPLDGELATDEIHVWFASLDQPALRFQRLLSMDERIKAEQFHFAEHRKRFTARRGILRTILGHYYLGVEPSLLQFCYGKNGKPALADTFGKGKICFNLSHSDEFAVYALARDRKIGVDIEHMRDIPEMEQIAERFFSPREKGVFHALPVSKKKEAFFNCWTRKEAFIKATGDGLSWPLDSFDVSLVPRAPAGLLKIEGDTKAASQWSVQPLDFIPNYAGAFAVKGSGLQVKFFKAMGN